MAYALTDIAAGEIEQLKADGIEPTPQEVLDIQFLSLACTEADEDVGSIARGAPVILDGDSYWPLTIAAHAFIDDVSPLFPDDDFLFVCMFAARFGREAEVIYERGKNAQVLIRKWRSRLRCTVGELVEAAEKLAANNAPKNPGEEENSGRIGELSLVASALCGGKPEDWETQLSITAVCRLVSIAWRQKLAEGISAKNDPRIMAVKRLGEYTLALRKARENG